MDLCENCIARGDIDKCINSKCNIHESWFFMNGIKLKLEDDSNIGKLTNFKPKECHPSFGNYIRASRLRFVWFKKGGYYVRVSGDGPFKFELCPADSKMLGKFSSNGEYRMIDNDILSNTPALININNLHKPQVIYVNEEGEQI